MMAFIIFLLLICAVVGSLLGPGLLLTRPLRITPLERLTLAIGFSGIVLYLFSFGVYVFGLPEYFHYFIGVGLLVALAFSLKDLRRLLSDKSVRLASWSFLFLLAWVLIHVCLVRSFSGGGWYGDWFEHYQRALFFLRRLPLEVHFLGEYWLPARPPLPNVLIAHFLFFAGSGFPLYQVIQAVMGMFVCLPLFLFAQHFERQFHRAVLLLVFFLALNPMFLQNAVYPWTRHLANFYILSGLYFYWRGYFEDNATKIGVSLLLLATAILVHYSAAPYAVCVAGHLLLRFGMIRILREKVVLVFSLASALLLFTWFGWSLLHFGLAITFGSNTTVLGAQGHSSSDFVGKFFLNLCNTLVPHWFRHVDTGWFGQSPFSVRLRDSVFLVVQSNLIGAVGLTGGLLFLFQTGLEFYRGSFRSSSWRFWTGISIAAILLSIAANPDPDEFGVAHVCLQPLVFLALAYLSVVLWETGLLFRSLAGIGSFVSYIFGVLLHFVLCGESFAGNEKVLAQTNFATHDNWQIKERFKLAFIGDLLADYQSILVVAEILTALLLCIAFIRWCLVLNASPPPDPRKSSLQARSKITNASSSRTGKRDSRGKRAPAKL